MFPGDICGDDRELRMRVHGPSFPSLAAWCLSGGLILGAHGAHATRHGNQDAKRHFNIIFSESPIQQQHFGLRRASKACAEAGQKNVDLGQYLSCKWGGNICWESGARTVEGYPAAS